MSRFLTLILSALLFVAGQQAVAATPAIAGKALVVIGNVSTRSTQGQEARTLQRGSDVYVGDIIVTGPKAQVQIKMSDDAIVSLSGDSEFAIQGYTYNQAGKQDEAALKLLSGSLRTVSGKIDKSSYKLSTPTATLGIRGTIYDVTVSPDGTVSVVVRDGAVNMTGPKGDALTLLAGQGGQSSPGLNLNTMSPEQITAFETLIAGAITTTSPTGATVYTGDTASP